MVIGIPAETSGGGNRAAITPGDVQTLLRHVHNVIVEIGARQKTGITDEEYSREDAQILSPREIDRNAELFIKVREYGMMHCNGDGHD